MGMGISSIWTSWFPTNYPISKTFDLLFSILDCLNHSTVHSERCNRRSFHVIVTISDPCNLNCGFFFESYEVRKKGHYIYLRFFFQVYIM